MTAPLVLLGLPVAASPRSGAEPVRLDETLERAWLASLEQALRRDRSLEADERRARKQGVCGVTAPAQPIVLGPSGPWASGPTMAADVSRIVNEAITAAHGTAEREPMRFHAEWADAGVRVWIGSDHGGDEAAFGAGLAAFVAELRSQLETRGVRLAAVTCNGREVWAAEASSEEDRSRTNPTEGP